MTTNGEMVVARGAGAWLAPQTLDEARALATAAAASGFFAVRRPEEALVILLTGQELGLAPMASLRGIYVVSGKPVISADMMVAIIRRSGLCASWSVTVSTADICTITTQRKGEPAPATKTWTIGDAKRAGLTGKGTWGAYPAAMLRHRCAADLAREVYPDAILGLYDPEELGGEPALDDSPAGITRDALATVVQMQAMAHVDDDTARDVADRVRDGARGGIDPRTAETVPAPAEPESHAAAAFDREIAAARSLAAVHDAWAGLLAGLHEEGADLEHWTAGEHGALAAARSRMFAAGHRLSNAEAGQVLVSRALAEVLDTQAGITAVAPAVAWWRAHKSELTGLDRAHRETPWYALARRCAGGAPSATATKAATAALKAALAQPEPDPEPTPTGTDPGRASAPANGNGHAVTASAALSQMVDLVCDDGRVTLATRADVVAYLAGEVAARKHLEAWCRKYGRHPLAVACAGEIARRLVALDTSDADGTRLTESAAADRVRAWATEGPRARVATLKRAA